MSSDQAFNELGLSSEASAADVRAARRLLALEHHPDVGGDPGRMTTVNEAAETALGDIEQRLEYLTPAETVEPLHDSTSVTTSSGVELTDRPSFTIEALPAEAFEGILVAASWIGQVLDEDPPYRLEAVLSEPFECWCQLEVVPDAGSSTVSLTIAQLGDVPPPCVELVRDVWVETLNQVNWDN